jgi:gamma-glutamylcyclotransferase (GGCT)/AIG2-like uncharacterized protein YtfP
MNITLELKDKDALFAACDRIGCRVLPYGSQKLFSSQEIGIGIMLSNWRYPVVVKDNGTVAFDTYEGQWGNIARLNELKAYYGLEKAKIEARRAGHSVYESVDEQTNDLVLRISI